MRAVQGVRRLGTSVVIVIVIMIVVALAVTVHMWMHTSVMVSVGSVLMEVIGFLGRVVPLVAIVLLRVRRIDVIMTLVVVHLPMVRRGLFTVAPTVVVAFLL